MPQSTDIGNTVDAIAESLLMSDTDQDAGENAELEEDELGTDGGDASAEDDSEGEEDAGEDDGQEDEAEGEENEEPQQTYTVKVDGKDVQVTLEELTRGYSGQAYIQQRMQETAAVRKEAETVYHALTQERGQLLEALNAVSAHLQSLAPQPPSKELLQSDPIRYLEEQVAYQEAVERQAQLTQHQSMLAQQQQEMTDRAIRAYLAEQAQQLVVAIPEFADPKKAEKLKTDLVKHGASYGYSAEELDAVQDARAIRVLHDAMRYRALMSGKGKIAQKQLPGVPQIKPSGTAGRETTRKVATVKARDNMRKTGSVDAVADWLLK